VMEPSQWLIAVPTDGSPEATFKKLENRVSPKGLAAVKRFRVPGLRVGTLDLLFELSDKLQSADSEAEQVVRKIEANYKDLRDDEAYFSANKSDKAEGKASQLSPLLVNERPPSQFLAEFQWDESKFIVELKLKDLAENVSRVCASYGDELRKNWVKYVEVKNALINVIKKDQGSLLLKPLHGLINPEDVIEGDYLTTAVVVFPAAREAEFLATYEKLEKEVVPEEFFPPIAEKKEKKRRISADTPDEKHKDAPEGKLEEEKEQEHALKAEQERLNTLRATREKDIERLKKVLSAGIVVPGSAKILHKEGEYVLARVVMLSQGAEAFKFMCRKNRYTIRAYTYNPEEAKSQGEALEKLEDERSKRWVESPIRRRCNFV